MGKEKSAKKVKKKKSTINMIRCNMCSKIFKDKWALYKHQAVHSTDFPYKCSICEYAGKRKQYLRKHMKVRHGGSKELECSVCGKAFFFGSQLKNHMRVHTGEKPHKCQECGKAFNALYSLNTHKLIHTDEKPFRCAFCAYACRDSSTLRKHQARHTGTESVYRCNMCDVTCKSRSLLKLHVAEKHLDVDVRRFECHACGRRFKVKSTLAVHIQAVHERSRTGTCEVCGLLLSNRANLSTHMRTHVDEKPYLCTVELCERRFNNSSSLRKHMVFHFPEEQLACGLCRKRFTRAAHLRRHLATHRPKVKRVQCHHCGVRFLNKRYLTNHIQRKHSGNEKIYKCDACDFVTTNKPSIVMHIKGKHKRMFLTKCTFCEKRFLRHTYLQRHYWSIHRFRYKIPTRQKKQPKKFKIKEEPLDELDDNSREMEVIPKVERMDEDAPLSRLAAADNQMEDIPEAVFEELIHPLMGEPGAVRMTLDHRRKDSRKYTVDKDCEALMKRKMKELLERTRQKKAALALERTRRKYNRLMKRAVQKSSIKDRQKIKYYNNKNCVQDNKRKEKPNELLTEHFSVDHETIDNIDQDVDKTNEGINAEERGNCDQENKDDTANVYTVSRSNIDGAFKAEVEESYETYGTQTSRVNYLQQLIYCKGTRHCIDMSPFDIIVIEENYNESKKKDNNNVLVVEFTGNQEGADDVNKVVDNVDEVITDAAEDNQAADDHVEEDVEEGKGHKKLKLNTHQCYVCFKLFETKDNLLDHCKVHFDVSNTKTWKKCPLCKYTTNISITRHIKLVHNIDIKLPYATFKDDNNDILKSKYYYDVGGQVIDKVEIIPSLKNLNRQEYKKIDKANRINKDKGVTKTKLVKKGKEWIVVREKVKIKDCLIPKLDDVANLDVKAGYIEHMKELYRVAKKKGVTMLFPCDSCDKVCQTLSALKLHGRKHQTNPKPFKPKVWKHKANATNKNGTKDKQITRVKTVINKNVELPKLDRRSKQAQTEAYIEANRKSRPKPIVNKHRCEKELKEFYENNIKGGDIEFWQFLKIYNKMGRENVNDFDDLVKTSAFGYHTDVPVIVNSNAEVIGEKRMVKKCTTDKRVSNKNTRKLALKAKLDRKEFEKRRNEIKKKLREKIRIKELEG